MVVKRASMLAMLGGCLAVSGWSPANANVRDLDVVYSKAYRDLKQGHYEEAMAAVTAVEGRVRTNVEREPGSEIRLLVIKARLYWHQMDVEGLERFLARFQEDYAETSAARWVEQAAWYERMLCYRFTENLPQAVEALERYRELEERRAARSDRADRIETLMRDFDLHVRLPVEIADLYRYMGRTDVALEKYRLALAYVTTHSEDFRPLDSGAGQPWIGSLSPARYREELLPTAIRECEAPRESALAILGLQVVCEVQQADWLLEAGRGYSQRRVLDAAREHYRKAQQPLRANQNILQSLPPAERTRYVALREHIANKMDICNAELIRLSTGGR
jgi:tetratricopeptide (TPR) repeat protein